MAEPTSRRPFAVGAAAIGGAMLVVYVSVLVAQGETQWFEVLPWALLMAIAGGAALAASRLEDRRVARNLMLVAAGAYALIGVAAILTIGIGFLVAAALATMAAIRM